LVGLGAAAGRGYGGAAWEWDVAKLREGGFVGRGEALAGLREELVRAALTPRVVWVEGESGVGKTALLRRVLSGVDGRVLVWVSGAEEERTLPYGLVAQLVGSLPVRLDAGGLLGGGLAGAAPAAVGAELLTALGELDGPVVVVVDDLHWVDVDSGRALLFALRRLQAERLLVVLVTRPDPEVWLGESWARLLRDEGVRRLGLSGLTAAELVELSEVMGSGRLELVTAERLQAHTDGHPLHARALLEELGAAGLTSARGVLPAPRSFASLVLAQVAALDAQTQQLVAAAAVLGAPASLATVAGVGRVVDPLLALDAAVAAGLLEHACSGAVRFVHPLVRAAVYGDLSPSRRVALHRAAAEVSEGSLVLAHRIAAAGGADPGLAAELEGLADGEVTAGRCALAVEHLQAAAALSGTPGERDRRVLLGVEAVLADGDLARLRSLRTVVEGCADTPQRRYLLGTLELVDGHLEDAEVLLSDAVAGAHVSGEGWVPRAGAGLALVRMLLGRWEEAIATARGALAGETGWVRGLALQALAVSLTQLGRQGDAQELLAELVAELGAGQRGSLDTLGAAGFLKLWADDFSGARTDLEAVAARARAGERAAGLVGALSVLGEAHYRLGDWDQAVVHGELAVSLARDTDQFLGLQQAHAQASYVHAGRGQFGLAEQHIDAAAALASLLPWWGAAVRVELARATLAQARGEPLHHTAVDLLNGPVRDHLDRLGLWPGQVLVIEALLDAGEQDAASRALARLTELIATGGATAAGVDVARLRGRLAEADRDPARARASYQAGAQLPAGLPLPAARLALAHGSLLRRLGERRAAIARLRSAHAGFVALAARPFLARCNVELAACGLPAAAGDGRDPFGLSAAELAVAHLVAAGATNRDTAALLYVSVKTVEYHLGNIYAKLGITSRRELPTRLHSGTVEGHRP
jgi:DNA-binding CsgD family transcriptional regulator